MKKLYHLYNEDLQITHAEFFIEGEQPENAIFIEVMNFIKPMVHPVTLEVYEGATEQEIENHNQSNSSVLKLQITSNPNPNDGDLWLEENSDTGLKIRINGVTKTISLT